MSRWTKKRGKPKRKKNAEDKSKTQRREKKKPKPKRSTVSTTAMTTKQTPKPKPRPKPRAKARPKPKPKPKPKPNPKKNAAAGVPLATLEALAMLPKRLATTLIMRVVKRVTTAILIIDLSLLQRRNYWSSRPVQVRLAKAKARRAVVDPLALTVGRRRARKTERALALAVNGAPIF